MERPNPADGLASTILGLRLRDEMSALIAEYQAGHLLAKPFAVAAKALASEIEDRLAGIINIKPSDPEYGAIVHGH